MMTVCSLPKQIYHLLRLNDNTTYQLYVGHLYHQVNFIASEHENQLLHIPHHVAKDLGLSPNVYLNIWRKGEHVYLGPVIGVFVNPQHLKMLRGNHMPHSVQLHVLANLLAHCLLYYFSYKDIDWREQRVKGYLYEPLSQTWRHDWFPFPNVIYDRCIGLKQHELGIAERTRQQLLNLTDISFINKSFLGKWELSTNLSSFPELHAYLPKTIKYTEPNDIFQMLVEHGFIYLKSSEGYGAREVLSIKKIKKQYEITFKKNQLIKLKVKSKSKIKALLKKFLKPKMYIVQQGVEAFKLGKLHLDLRLLLQKNRQGIWNVTYNRARITEANNSIINSTLAKKVINYRDLAESLQQSNMATLPSEQTINQLAITIAERIEHAFGSFGELGLDLIIDQTGKIWFIEANSKPTKKINRQLEQETGIIDQFLSVLDYAKYLQKVKQNSNVQIKYLQDDLK